MLTNTVHKSDKNIYDIGEISLQTNERTENGVRFGPVKMRQKSKSALKEPRLISEYTETSSVHNEAPHLLRSHSLYGANQNCKFGPKGLMVRNQENVVTIQDPGSQRLMWHKPPLSVLLIKKIHDDSIIDPFVELILWLVEKKKMMVFLETKVMDDPVLKQHANFDTFKRKITTFKEGVDDLQDKIDLIITLGGDGTLLYASTLFQQSVPPVMAFHFGSLGFLSPFDFVDFKEKISQVLEGNVPLCLRTRLKCSVKSEEKKYSKKRADKKESIKNVESKQHVLVKFGGQGHTSWALLFRWTHF